MMRYLISLNLLMLYVIYVGGKLDPKPLHPIHGSFGWLALIGTGLCVLYAIIAVLREKQE